MAFQTMSSFEELHGPVTVGDSASYNNLLDKNTLTTAGVVLASGGAVAGTMVLTAAIPVPVLTLAATSAALIYAGDRQDKGLPINPFVKEDSKETVETTTVETTEDAVVATA